MEVDPRFLTAADWDIIQSILIRGWMAAGFMLSFAFLMALAHAIVPSLVATRHIPQRAQSSRVLFYLLGFAALAGAAFTVASILGDIGIVQRIYPHIFI